MNPKQFLNLNQGRLNACTMFACVNAIYKQFKIQLDPIKLWRQADTNGDGSGLYLDEVCTVLKKQGFSFSKISGGGLGAIKANIERGIPVVLSVYAPEIDPKQTGGYHAVVAYKVVGDIIYYINSWDPTWGPFNNNTGYFRKTPGSIKWMLLVKK